MNVIVHAIKAWIKKHQFGDKESESNLYESEVSYKVLKKLVFYWHGTHEFPSVRNVVNPA